MTDSERERWKVYVLAHDYMEYPRMSKETGLPIRVLNELYDEAWEERAKALCGGVLPEGSDKAVSVGGIKLKDMESPPKVHNFNWLDVYHHLDRPFKDNLMVNYL